MTNSIHFESLLASLQQQMQRMQKSPEIGKEMHGENRY